MTCRLGKLKGESLAPVDREHQGRGEPLEDLIEIEFPPKLVNWRKRVCSTSLGGLLREICLDSELVVGTENEVVLRPRSRVLVSQARAMEISEILGQAAGHPVSVRFTDDERSANALTASLLIESERRAARRAMVDAFAVDPFVQQCLKSLSGTLDVTSVRCATEIINQQEEKQNGS